jgi:hypothetical protein
VVIPEGLIESIPELKLLLRELDDVYKESTASGVKLTAVCVHFLYLNATLLIGCGL